MNIVRSIRMLALATAIAIATLGADVGDPSPVDEAIAIAKELGLAPLEHRLAALDQSG